MKQENYIIKYEVIDNNGNTLKFDPMKVKNCLDSIHAQVKLENYLKKKVINFNKLVVHTCTKSNSFNDIFSKFGNSNPFNF